MAKKKNEATKIFQFKIKLKDAPVPIWRTILVANNISFEDLHEEIQKFMGWENSHLYHFIVGTRGNISFILDDRMEDDYIEGKPASKTLISEVFHKEKDKLIYEYDMGDSWNHEVVLEKILELNDVKKYPICIDGKGKCPPEDCGGVFGYAEILDILKDKKHEEHEEYLDWLGIKDASEWDPKEFEIED